MTRGNLTERLLAQGLLSPKMLAELQREWQQQVYVYMDKSISGGYIVQVSFLWLRHFTLKVLEKE